MPKPVGRASAHGVGVASQLSKPKNDFVVPGLDLVELALLQGVRDLRANDSESPGGFFQRVDPSGQLWDLSDWSAPSPDGSSDSEAMQLPSLFEVAPSFSDALLIGKLREDLEIL